MILFCILLTIFALYHINLMKKALVISLFLSIFSLSYGQSEGSESDPIELPEFVYESHKIKALHILAYVREYSTISTYTDTVAMYREKIVDYMLAPGKKSNFRGWRIPRVLSSRSYYRFTNSHGLDSVSNRYNHHFSWSDWVGIPPAIDLPEKLHGAESASDTIMGKYSPTEIWRLSNDSITVKVDVLADTLSRKWVPAMSQIFYDIDWFDQFKLAYRYYNVGENSLNPTALDEFSYLIESRGRGRNIYLFTRPEDTFFVSTSAEVYVLDKEFVTIKEAKKWERLKIVGDEFEVFSPSFVPDPSAEILSLINRVNEIDHDLVRQGLATDKKLIGRNIAKLNPGQQILKRLKGMFGIDNIIGNYKREKGWRDFRSKQRRTNR